MIWKNAISFTGKTGKTGKTGMTGKTERESLPVGWPGQPATEAWGLLQCEGVMITCVYSNTYLMLSELI